MGIQETSVSLEWGGRTLTIETGSFAQLAGGSVTVQYGETIVLATATMAREARPGIDFFPLTVDFEERMYAAGKIPGSRFVRRETRPGEDAILNGRLIDRSIRPLFDKDAANEVQVVLTSLSVDGENELDIPGLIAASAALTISDIPFNGPIAGAKIGLIDGDLVINPTRQQVEAGGLELVVSSSERGVLMIEAGAKQVPEDRMEEAIEMAFRFAQPVIKLQRELQEKIGKAKAQMTKRALPENVVQVVDEKFGAALKAAIATPTKTERNEALDELRKAAAESLADDLGDDAKAVPSAIEKLAKKYTRQLILGEGKRPDGRAANQLRELSARVSLLPRTHGTGLFARGATQVLTIATLGAPGDEKIIDGLDPEEKRRYLHHYNFPPYSVGEARPMRAPGRREIGHGALAEKALVPVLPTQEQFPYTLRLVSEVLSSNGSTSMASVCGSTLALMDAGVPIEAPVAGISIGLVSGDTVEDRVLLTDIIGVEDFYGDMDFKVAGTTEGITAIQLDTKAEYLPLDMMHEVFEKARTARLEILRVLTSAIDKPREALSQYAPRILTVNVPVERIGEIIGPGGKTIRGIVEKTGAKIDIEDDGTVYIASLSADGGEQAAKIIRDMVREVEVGEIYDGTVTRIMNFGAFVEIMPGREGLIRISDLAWDFVNTVEDVLKMGDEVRVKVAEIDDQGRINLSRKALIEKPEGYVERERAPREGGFGNRGGERGGFSRDRGPREGGFNRERGGERSGGFGDRAPREGGFNREGGSREGGNREGGGREGGRGNFGGYRGSRERGPREGNGERSNEPREGNGERGGNGETEA